MNYKEIIPDNILEFLKEFAIIIKKNDLKNVTEYYLTKWDEFTKTNYKTTNWPHVSTIEINLSLKGEFKDIFLCLYKERYYSHIFNRLTVFDSKNDLHLCLRDHADSFQNFINLFNLILKIWREDHQSELKTFQLPNVWLWDLIHNFVNQCQAFHLWKSLLRITDLNIDPKKKVLLETTWSVRSVFRYLYIFSWFAGIPIRLGLEIEDSWKSNNQMKQILGQFSVIGILRMNTLLGDYTTALECLENLDLKTINVLTISWTCDITICYHQTVCYMMKGRFLDALNIFPEIIAKYESFFKIENTNKSVMNRFQLWFHRLGQMQILCKFLSFQEINRTNKDSFLSEKDWILYLYDNSKPDFLSLFKKNEKLRDNYLVDTQKFTFSLLIEPFFSLKKTRVALKIYRSVDLNHLKGNINHENFIVELLKHKLNTRQIQKQRDNLPHQGMWECSHNSDFFIEDNVLKCQEIKSIVNYAEDISKLIRNTCFFEMI